MRTPTYDVVVVGGGPAGSSLSLRLARVGLHVALLDAARFPRSKPCGDAISPGASPLLDELGLMQEIRGHGAMLSGWRIRSPAGDWMRGVFDEARKAPPAHGLTIDRRILDSVLLDAARAHGVAVFERRRVMSCEPVEDDRAGPREEHGRTIVARGPSGEAERFRTRFVVGADGLRSRVARWLGPIRRGPRPRIALVSRYRGVTTGGRWGELRLSREGVLGYAPTSADTCNITVVVPVETAREVRPDPAAFVADRIRRYEAESLVLGGYPDRPTEVTGPFECSPSRRTAPGVLLVGDAAGYFDPLTGQGVFRALLGAKLAARAIRAWLEDPASGAEPLASYEQALDLHLRPARRIQRWVDRAVSTPIFINPATRVLQRRPAFASRLVDATGDRLDVRELRRPGPWLGSLLRSPRETSEA